MAVGGDIRLVHLFDAKRWHITQIGTGRVTTEGHVHLDIAPTAAYTDAQITDYDYSAWQFVHRPPLTLTVRARADVSLGTAGFGLWNHPLSPDVRRFPRLPAAIWWFYGAPPTDLRLALGVPGHGWKAAVIDAAHWRALALAPVAPLLMLAMRSPRLYPPIYRRVQRVLKISEAALNVDLLHEMHTYRIEWRTDSAHFSVDDRLVHHCAFAPRAALGFIAWVDNQMMVATPQGAFRWGVIPCERPQSMTIQSITIESGISTK